jgi:hypothetical protein
LYGPMSTLGCVVYRTDSVGRPCDCFGAVTHAGMIYFGYPRPTAWLAFACAEHAGHLIAARPMLERDRAELARRRQARAQATGRRWNHYPSRSTTQAAPVILVGPPEGGPGVRGSAPR